MDPYKVLGVSPTATDAEIKTAYRNLAKKYHPDKYRGHDLEDLAGERLKEINEAYEMIQKQRASSSSQSSYSSYDSEYSYSNNENFRRIREAINAGRYSDADIMLDSISQNERNAEWHFLKGCILIQRGWIFDAQKYLETACYMDPSNAEYRNMLSNIRANANGYNAGYKTTTQSASCSGCDICTGLMCADCCCEMCGGDCIRCC